MLHRSVFLLICLAGSACASYPDFKGGQKLVCWSKKPFLTGEIKGKDGLLGRWTSKERVSSIYSLKKFTPQSETAFGTIIVSFPDPQPIFNELKLQSKNTVISRRTETSTTAPSYRQFDGRPYYLFFFNETELEPYIGTTESLEIVAYSDEGTKIARQVINIDYLAQALSEIDVMISDSKDMRENRRNECQYQSGWTMPIVEHPW